MAVNNTNGNDDLQELLSWIPAILMLIFFWPVGVYLLYRKLMGYTSSGRKRTQSSQRQYTGSSTSTGAPGYHYQYQYRYKPGETQAQQGAAQQSRQTAPQQTAQTAQAKRAQTQPGMQGVSAQERDKKGRYIPKRKPVNLNRGKGLVVMGIIIAAISGLISLGVLGDLMWSFSLSDMFASLFPALGFLGGGLVMAYAGRQRQKKAKRFRKYLALIGKRENISIASLAQAMPVSIRTACDDLQEMLDEGMIPRGYLDMSSGRLILSDEGLEEQPSAPEKPKEEEKPQDDDAILKEIRAVNDAIADPVMSGKIDRIEEITGKILTYQKQNPAKAGELRTFLNYYLPTTLKILNAYAQMEAQGIEGENIRSAKERIEGMMDKVVEGFEKQLDKLFADSAMDITTDVEVLERMLDKDGLSGGQGLTLGG